LKFADLKRRVQKFNFSWVCEEIEKQKGAEGIIELIKCGRGDDNFFKSIENLIGINRQNFDKEVYRLIFNQ
jgi:hypothetical protein